MTEHPHPLEGKLESECRDLLSAQDAYGYSIAISLKRIADVLEGTNERLGLADSIYTALETVSINIMHRRS